jgi:uncharacterized protein
VRVDIADIKTEAGEHKRVPLAAEAASVPDVRFDGPVTGDAEVWNTGDSFLVKARLNGTAVLECSRCLGEFRLPLAARIEEHFKPGQPSPTGELEEDDEGRTFSFYEGDEIDLTEPLRQQVLLELPMKPLCAAACRGLCPNCGANLNDEPCRCEPPAEVDPRLASLKRLLEKTDSD